jgi:radical SAM superfamily enzyme YgiQ (UPF0313 family)
VKVRFVYPRFARHAESHPELRSYVPCNEYFGPPSLGIASLAAVTPKEWEIDFRDDRLEDVGLDDDGIDLVAISCFTPSGARALALADAFRARGRRVVLGGIFPTMLPALAAEHADAVVLGEGDGVWPEVLRDAAAGELRPRYAEHEPVDLTHLPPPRVDLYMEKEGRHFAPDDYPVQVSRGCPLTCIACAIPATAGRRLRHLPLEHVLAQIDQLAARGKLASLTEDTSFFVGSGAQRRFGELLDALVARGQPAAVSYVGISMPMILATPESIFRRMHAAGIRMFYLVGGFDPITQRAFTGEDARAEERALAAVQKAIDLGIEPYTSFLVGNDDDDEGTFDRMLSFADAAGIRKAEFAILTPYPGTPVWARLRSEDRILTFDWSKYNDANVVFRPKRMTPERLLEGYLYLWREFYRSRRSLADLGREERTIQF